ncbi:hypothetical protein LDL08_35175 [Nonomuraea glycinis]|uniref:Uncharacterized protein n=1 Tax=Nonomuraea glycinis TaxID=2047744 RepID=A0A918ACK9_9ACTN|nr:hypothetical protein [Nonomuraea glycinis]MCA2181420.1 hypothetical protein [Nonomuraea glycinis]GGP14438.1 hypothetical protein GCM10012278_70240 [Nonomuraea glycinis]
MTNQTSGGFLGDLEEAFAPPAAGGCCGSPSSVGEPSGVAGQSTEPAAAATACCGSPAAASQAAQSGCCGQAPAPVGSQAGSQAGVQGGSGCCG